MADTPVESFEGRTLLGLLWRRRLLIGVIILITTSVAAGVSASRPDRYQATAELLLAAPDTNDDRSRAAQTNAVRTIESEAVASLVRDRLGYSGDIAVRPVADSDVLLLTGTSSDPDRAAATANAYADVYLERRRERQLQEIADRRAELQTRYDAASADLDALTEPLRALDAQIAQAASEEEAVVLADRRERLDRDISAQRQSLVGLQTTYAQQLNELQLAQSTLDTVTGEVLSRAEPPGDPFEPKPVRDAAAAAVVGAVFAIALVVLIERSDDTVLSAQQLNEFGPPVLGEVPKISGRNASADVLLGADRSPDVAEAFRQVRTAINFIRVAQPVRSIMVTSGAIGEGKTTSALDLAAASAWDGMRVCLIEADLRRPTISARLDSPATPGLTDVLLGDATLEGATRCIGTPGVAVLSAGTPPPNPAELLGLDRFRAVVDEAAEQYDLVIVDSTPALLVADALVTAAAVDATVVVVARGISSRRTYEATLRALEQTGTPVIGTIFNLGERVQTYDAAR